MDCLANQKLLKKNGEVVEANAVLQNKKIICYYFSAHWCPPCRAFTPVLADFYAVRSLKNLLKIFFMRIFLGINQ